MDHSIRIEYPGQYDNVLGITTPAKVVYLEIKKIRSIEIDANNLATFSYASMPEADTEIMQDFHDCYSARLRPEDAEKLRSFCDNSVLFKFKDTR